MKGKTIIIKLDGGICQQLRIYSYAHELMSRGHDVLFDTTWFADCGMDMDGRFVRNLDLRRAFPDLPFEEAPRDSVERYKKLYFKRQRDVEKVQGPAYISLDGYQFAHQVLLDERKYLIEHFSPIDAEVCEELRQNIAKGISCAVHVRRGDVAQYSEAFGWPCTVDYFLRAMQMISTWEPQVHFYLFSDEPEWVERELVPQLPKGIIWTLCQGHGSDKGYLDLWLMSHARHIIASQGTFGKCARILNKREEVGYTITPNGFDKLHRFDKVVVLWDKGYDGAYSRNDARIAGCLAEYDEVADWEVRKTITPSIKKRILKLMINLIPIASWRREVRCNFLRNSKKYENV